MEGLTFTSHILRFVSSRHLLHTRVKKGFIIYKSYLFKNSLSTNEIRGIAFRKELLSYLLNRYSYCRNITC